MQSETFEAPDALPLFPLATVLVPGAVLPLHIFEERYKEMMRYAIENQGMYGLSFRDNANIGKETVPEVGSVGCLAKINAVMPLEDGRLNLISTGIIRYRVNGYNQMLPFLIAQIETFTDELEADEELTHLYESLKTPGKELLEAAKKLDEAGLVLSNDLPDDPESFSFLMTSILPLENDIKQSLLEMTSTKIRLMRLRTHINNTLANYTNRLQMQERAKTNGHGKLQ
ncbi:MAG: LON peptidase substrate-binding domain-containing protein [Acidobacteriota bacterium]